MSDDKNIIVYYDKLNDNIWTGVFYTVDHRYYLIGPDDLAIELELFRNRWIPDYFIMLGRLDE